VLVLGVVEVVTVVVIIGLSVTVVVGVVTDTVVAIGVSLTIMVTDGSIELINVGDVESLESSFLIKPVVEAISELLNATRVVAAVVVRFGGRVVFVSSKLMVTLSFGCTDTCDLSTFAILGC